MMQGQSRQTAGANGGEGDPADPNKKYFFLNVKAYRKYFNVDTNVSLSCSVQGVLILWLDFHGAHEEDSIVSPTHFAPLSPRPGLEEDFASMPTSISFM